MPPTLGEVPPQGAERVSRIFRLMQYLVFKL